MSFVILLVSAWISREDYTFVKADRTRAAMQIYNATECCLMVGYIDENGTFVCAATLKSKLFGRTSNKPLDESMRSKTTPHFLEQSPIDYNIINKPRYVGESVFEYRSARLIPGYLNGKWIFVPELSEKMIDFADYAYSEQGMRIYNLPGKFVKRSEYEAEKAKLEKESAVKQQEKETKK